MIPIEDIWQRLLSNTRASGPVYQRVDESHPIDFYAGIGTDGARLLMLISAIEPSHGSNYHAFDVLKSRRADGRWTVTVELRRAEFVHVFAHLCDDLLAASRTECKPEEAAIRNVDTNSGKFRELFASSQAKPSPAYNQSPATIDVETLATKQSVLARS
jgi:Putative  PD-(D/E)XK family member, (DUF4420)